MTVSRRAAAQGTTPTDARFVARVYVTLKPTVNDPAGSTIAGALQSLGFASVEAVRAGRFFLLTVAAPGKGAAEMLVDQMCARLLANPVIETYSYEVDEAPSPA